MVERALMVSVVFAGMVPLEFGDVFIWNDRQCTGDDGSLCIVGGIQNDSSPTESDQRFCNSV